MFERTFESIYLYFGLLFCGFFFFRTFPFTIPMQLFHHSNGLIIDVPIVCKRFMYRKFETKVFVLRDFVLVGFCPNKIIVYLT